MIRFFAAPIAAIALLSATAGGALLAAAIAAAPSAAPDLESGEVRTQDDIGRARPSMSEVSGAG